MFTSIDDEWSVELLQIFDEHGQYVIIGSIDALFVSQDLMNRIMAEIKDKNATIMLFATHTHNAPSLAPEIPLIGKHDSNWYSQVVTRIASALNQLHNQQCIPVLCSYGEEETNLNINRRKWSLELDYKKLVNDYRLDLRRKIVIAPNKKGIIDKRVQLFFLEDANSGKTCGVIWTFSAHPAFYPDNTVVSADFPGIIREKIRNKFGSDCVVIYLPGFAGSAIPKIPFKMPFPLPLKTLFRLSLPFHKTMIGFQKTSYTGKFQYSCRAKQNRFALLKASYINKKIMQIFLTRPYNLFV